MKVDAWIPVFHVAGAVLWVSGLTGSLALLTVHAKVDQASRAALTALEKKVAMVMDLGATLAIAVGLWRALKVTPNLFTTGGWLHIKLTAVVLCILSVHGFTRAKIKKFSRGEVTPVPVIMWVLLAVGVAVAITFGAQKGLMRS